jgi:hypothetical protein
VADSGSYNTFLGYRAGYNNRRGLHNVYIGYLSGNSNVTGSNNVYIGDEAGRSNTIGGSNVFLGNEAGYLNTEGSMNLMIGDKAGYSNLTGDNNVLLGWYAGDSNTSGVANIAIGFQSGGGNTTGDGNIYLGPFAGGGNLAGDNNVFIGSQAGSSVKGSKNVMLGNNAGYYETHSEKLYIENSNVDSTAALIWGDFADDVLRFNGAVGIGVNPHTRFAIGGLSPSAAGTTLRIVGTDVYYTSSSRYTKKDIVPLVEDFTKILSAKPVSFIDISTNEKCIGYIAEDFEEIGLNNLVIYRDGKPISVSYELVSLYNLEIIKEQQQQILSTQQENQRLKSELQTLREEVDQIKSMLAKGDTK